MAVPMIRVPAEGSLGPKMRGLNEKQRAFVIAMAELGTADYTRCARMAGYVDNGNGSIQVTAHRLAHDELIQAAMHEEAERRLNVGGLMAVEIVRGIASDPTNKTLALKASAMLMDRSGHHARTEHTVKVRDESRTEEAMIERAKQLALELGWDQSQIQKALAPFVIEGEFVEVGKEEWE